MAFKLDPYHNYPTKTMLGPSTTLEGTLAFTDSVTILGKFTGEVNAKGLLVLGPHSEFYGDIVCDKVVIGGVVHGNVTARQSLIFFETGKLYGDVRTAKLRIADGVIFEGQCEMIG